MMTTKDLLACLFVVGTAGCNADDAPIPCQQSGAGAVCCKGDECGELGPGLSQQELDDLIATCNFVVTEQYNAVMGNPPYQITPACQGTLGLLVDMTEKLDTYPNYAGYKNHIIKSLHYLFFHPLATSADGVLFERSIGGDKVVTGVLPSFLAPHVQAMPLDWDIEMTTQTANTGIIEYWFDNIYLVAAENSVLDKAAAYNKGQVGVYNPFLSTVGDPRAGAAVLFHELAHVQDEYASHIGCFDACESFPDMGYDLETEGQCDCQPWSGPYMNGGALLWAMTMGGLAAHPPGVDDRILDIEDEYVTGPFWPATHTSIPGSLEQACRTLISKSGFQRRTLAEEDKDPWGFCANVVVDTLAEWELYTPAPDETPVAPPNSLDLSCGHTDALLGFSGISIVGNTVMVPQSLVDEAFADIGLTMAGSWTEPVMVADPSGAIIEAAEIQNLRPSSILGHLGLQLGDRITYVDGMSVAEPALLLRSYPDPSQVQQVVVDLLRDGAALTLTIQVQLPT